MSPRLIFSLVNCPKPQKKVFLFPENDANGDSVTEKVVVGHRCISHRLTTIGAKNVKPRSTLAPDGVRPARCFVRRFLSAELIEHQTLPG